MNIIEYLIACVAPHICIRCGAEGALACSACLAKVLSPTLLSCYRCCATTKQSHICQSCSIKTGIHCVTYSCYYNDDLVKTLLFCLKFQRAKDSGRTIADSMRASIPDCATVVCPVPTAPGRVRRRGYDQSDIIARRLAKRLKSSHKPLLGRLTGTRQVGSTKRQRRVNMKSAFYIKNSLHVKNNKVMLIDDVLTTGATLEAAAKILLDNGAQRVCAATFAFRPMAKESANSTKTDT